VGLSALTDPCPDHDPVESTAGNGDDHDGATKVDSVIEVLQDMPKGVTGIRVSGRIAGDDLREFKPVMDEALKSGEIRIVEVIASDYEGFGPGGLAEDLKLGLGHTVGCRPRNARRVHGLWRAQSRFA
jgi:hypothetical protein